MAVNEQIVTGRKFRKLIDEATKLWQRISFWTKASDVEFDDGSTAETKMGAINGITDSLASTSSNIAASAKALSQVNNKLTFPDGESFYLDVKDGERGYNSDPARGADTFRPFKSKPKIVLIGSGNTTATKTFSATSIKGYNKLTSDNFFLRPSVHGQGGGSSRGSYGISYNPATGIVTVNEYVIVVTEWDRPFCAYLIYQLYAYV